MAKEETLEVELDDAPGATFVLKYFSQKKRDEINERHTPRGQIYPNWKKVTQDIADEMLVGWSGVTRSILRRLGFQDAEALAVDDDGLVPYSIFTGRRLYTECDRTLFAGPLEAANRSLLEAIDRKNALASPSSPKLPASTA